MKTVQTYITERIAAEALARGAEAVASYEYSNRGTFWILRKDGRSACRIAFDFGVKDCKLTVWRGDSYREPELLGPRISYGRLAAGLAPIIDDIRGRLAEEEGND